MPTSRRLLPLTALALLTLGALAGCSGDDDDAGFVEGKLAVAATIAPVGAIATAVGGDLVEVRVIVGSGGDPHDYELKSSDRKAIDRAKLVLRNGAGIDSFLDKAVSGEKEKLVTLTNSLELREGGANEDEGEHPDEGDDHGDRDPHAWHDIDLVKAMADAAAKAFGVADPANADRYRQNADAYKARLTAADAEIRKLIDSIPAANRKMVTNHDAFGYFIERYGLEFVGAVIPSLTTAAEPSAKQTTELVDTIKREGVRAIFAESSVDPKIAEQIAKETGVKIVDDLYGDSLGERGSGAETIEGMLLANAKKIAEALK